MNQQKRYETFNFIASFIEVNGYAPLVKEVAAFFGITSAGALQRINRLCVLGFIEYTPGKYQSFRIVKYPVNRQMEQAA